MSGAYDAHVRRKRDAVRILHILHAAGRPVKGAHHPPDAIKVIEAEKRLQALDFWCCVIPIISSGIRNSESVRAKRR